jgi:hypothetical protein
MGATIFKFIGSIFSHLLEISMYFNLWNYLRNTVQIFFSNPILMFLFYVASILIVHKRIDGNQL